MKKSYTRREFGKTVIPGAIALSALGATLSSTEGQAKVKPKKVESKVLDKPNILLVVMDQERSLSDLPATLDLPVRRKFAQEALSFTNYHVNTVPCAPSRAVIWTGQHAQHTGVIANPGHSGSRELDPNKTPTMPQCLKALGYYTALKGKWHLTDLKEIGDGDHSHALDHIGYDEWQVAPDSFGATHEAAKKDSSIAEEASHFIHQRSASNTSPWFLTVNFIHPHDVMWYDATGEQQSDRIGKRFVSEMAGSLNRSPFTDDLGYDLPKSFYAEKSSWPYAHAAYKEINDTFYGALPDDENAYKRLQNFYFNCLRDSEKNIDQVLQAVENSGQSDNTVIIITSDHGEMAGAHRQRNKGPFMFKENIRVPLMVKYPKASVRGENATVCSSVDLMPTVLQLAGVEDDALENKYPQLKGVSLMPFLSEANGAKVGRDIDGRGILVQYNSLTHTNPAIFRERMLERIEAKKLGKPPRKRSWPYENVQFEVRGFGRGIFDGRYKFARWFSPADHHKPETLATLLGRNDIELIDTWRDPNE